VTWRGSTTFIGRYALFEEIASGGMASVHYGRLLGPDGFSRTVAIKRLHAHLAKDKQFSSMFRDEARVAARIRHPNVVPTLDVVSTTDELFLVMEYVLGEALSRLLRTAGERNERVPPDVAATIIVGVLHGLHAAHEAVDENGAPLGVVHRDVSPQNVMIGLDGTPRIVDFGIASAEGRLAHTREGELKGKLAYMSPEQIAAAPATRLVDVYATAVMFWETLTTERLFASSNDAAVLDRVMHMEVAPPSRVAKEVPRALDPIVLRGLARDPAMRFPTARAMAREIENAVPLAPMSRVAEWVESLAGEALRERAAKVAEIESRRDSPSMHEEALAAILDRDHEVTRQDRGVANMPPREAASWSGRDALLFVVVSAGLVALVLVLARFTATKPSVVVAPPASIEITSAAARVPAPSAIELPVVEMEIASASASAAPSASEAPTASPSPSSSSKAVRCTPPFTVDVQGIKHYKLDCL
jgi:serine/threonine-protein kinase